MLNNSKASVSQKSFMGMPTRIFLVLAVLFSLLFFAGCEEIEEDKPWIQVERPDMLFTDTTLMDSYDKGIQAWKLKTAYLERWGNRDLVFVRPVLVDIYDSLGERVAFLRADSGRMDMKFTYVYAYGHVYALTPKGASVRSDSLLWNKRDNLVRTESYVRVVSEDGDVLQGKGFISDARMENWRIQSNVTGIFQDAAKRLKEEDKKEAVELEKRDNPPAASAKPAPVQHVAPPKPALQAPPPAQNSAAQVPAQVPGAKTPGAKTPGAKTPGAKPAEESKEEAAKKAFGKKKFGKGLLGGKKREGE